MTEHLTLSPRQRPEEVLRRQFAQAAGLPFADLLSTKQLQQVLDDCQVEIRKRSIWVESIAIILIVG